MKTIRKIGFVAFVAGTIVVWTGVNLKVSGIADRFVLPASENVRSCFTAGQKRQVKIGGFVDANVVKCWKDWEQEGDR